MGVVKEVVAALERSPVSAKDLNDLKVGTGTRGAANRPCRLAWCALLRVDAQFYCLNCVSEYETGKVHQSSASEYPGQVSR